MIDGRTGEWLDWLIARMFQLMHTHEPDNFDAERYRGQSPNTFYFNVHAAYFSFLLRNVERFFQARELLADQVSRDLFDQLILFRVMSHLHVRLPFNTPEHRGQGATADSWRVVDTDDAGLLGPLAIFLVPGKTGDIRVKCWRENVAATWLQRQYYFERDGVRIEPGPGDHIVDAGGCFGDTALEFAAVAGPSGRVHTFDPIPKHCAVIRENLAMNPALAPRIAIHEVGLAAHERVGRGRSGSEGVINPGATAFDESISTTTLDTLAANGTLPRVDFIKMDIEGSELDALKGAESVLRAQRPRLAISLYHRREDLFAIPLWIDALGVGYRFHLEHYSIHHEETVLYAAC